MILNGVDFETYFKHYPDENGFFGPYGGRYISDDLKAAMEAGKADKRWNTGANYWQTPEALTLNTEAKHQFWPIPEKELAVNTLLEQNSYWK